MAASRYIQFTCADGKRRTLRLPGFTASQVKVVARHVRALNAACIGNLPVDEETARWVAGVKGWLREKLIEAELIDNRDTRPKVNLGDFLAGYMANRGTLVDSGKLANSTTNIDQLTADCLNEFFGPDKGLRDISEGDCFDFYDWLLAEGGRPVKRCGSEMVIRQRKPLAESTVRKRCSIASKFFLHARRKKFIDDNPFDEVDKGNVAATDNEFITADHACKVLDQLIDPQWRLLFGLARWGGMRIGSEPRQLRWGHIEWDDQKFLIHAPKTRRHVGKETRLVPLFNELLPLLQACRTGSPRGDALVLPMLADRSDSSLRDPMHRAIIGANLPVWANLWRSLRSTRQTELEDQGIPTHVVCAWLGNSPKVAEKHYLKVHEGHYTKALTQAAS